MSSRNFSEEEIQDLTDRVFLLKERLQAGKIRFANQQLADGFRHSFEDIRLRPDGRVDPTTVDGRIRATTLAIVAFHQREEAKKSISLAQIQSHYFDFLFRQFGEAFGDMRKAGASPAQAAAVISRDEKTVESIVADLPELLGVLNEFWSSVGEPGSYHLQDGQQLKATFGGDLFPSHSENAVSTAGLYIDTIILPCPITRIAPLVNVIPPREVVELLLKHTFTAMTYRDVAIADVNPPIALILPNADEFDSDRRHSLLERARPWTLRHAEHLFGRTFESLDHLADFCGDLISPDQVFKELKQPDRLLFDTEWGRGAQVQLIRSMAEGKYIPPDLDKAVAGNHVFSACMGRLPQALGAQENANYFGGTPLINAETSWIYYTWLLEYQGLTSKSQEHRQSLHVVKALTSEAHNNLEWLGNVPLETVLEIRKKGLAEDIRSLLGNGVSDLIRINPDNYFRTADQVVENLDRAFREHQRRLLDAKQKKLRLYGIDVPACLAVGGVAVAAALTANVGLGALSGILGIAGLPNLKDIKTKFKEITAEDYARRASPTGLLFRHIKRKL